MASNVNFIVNNKIEVWWEDQYYKSNIEDVQDEVIAISIPIKEGQYLPLRKGERVEAIYYAAEEERYRFDSVVAGRKVDGIPVILIFKPKNLELIQRRNHVRIPFLSEIQCIKLDKSINIEYKNQYLDENGEVYVKGTVLDLSGGGMKLKLKEELKLRDKIEVKLTLDDEEFELIGEIVRAELMEDKTYLYGVNFIEIDKKTNEKLIRCIFHVMRNRMKKI